MERGWMKYLPIALVAVLAMIGVVQLLRPHKPRRFREDPIGALKDHSEILADRAQDATEETLTRIQESLDELRGRLPEINRRRMQKRRKQINKRLVDLNDQVQSLVKDLRGTSIFSR